MEAIPLPQGKPQICATDRLPVYHSGQCNCVVHPWNGARLIGIFFRFWAVKKLGKFFRSKVSSRKHRLIKSGPYTTGPTSIQRPRLVSSIAL
jgi:hypothetical protein